MPTRRSGPLRVMNVAGARGDFVKIASLMKAYAATDAIEPTLVHTGRYDDWLVSDARLRDLAIPKPDVHLGVGSGSDAVQTAQTMTVFEEIVIGRRRSEAVLVVGDANHTIACGLVAAELRIPVVHVEAGRRSGHHSKSEQINRVLTDALSDLLLCTEQADVDNLGREGADPDQVFLVGNVLIDTLLAHRERAEGSSVLERLGLDAGNYGVLALDCPSNVDDPLLPRRIVDAADAIQRELPLVAPIHPRLEADLMWAGLHERLQAMAGGTPTSPLGYLDFLKLMTNAKVVLTDSRCTQEEATILRVPCLTVRDSAARPVTLDVDTNQLLGSDPTRILAAYHDVLANPPGRTIPPLWDGQSAKRIVDRLVEML